MEIKIKNHIQGADLFYGLKKLEVGDIFYINKISDKYNIELERIEPYKSKD